MDPTPAEPPPGCLVLLLRLSAGMTCDVVTPRGETPALVAARFLADDLIEGLVNTAAVGYAVGAVDVAVLGYHTSGAGAPHLASLLPDGDHRPRFVPLAQVCDMPAVARGGEGQPRKWAVLPEPAGEPCAAAALAGVYQMVAVWLTGRYSSRPPVVIHCAGADGFDAAYFRVARSLNRLATAHGPVRLMHYVFDPQPGAEVRERLAAVSADLPTRRAVFLNEWDIGDPWELLFAYAPQEDGAGWGAAGPGFARACAMWAQKMGNTPEQWEDAYSLDETNGAAAIADGASSGIYCSIWAQQLSQRFLTDRPDARDPVALNRWVNGLRTEWRTAINYSNLNWSKQAKVDQVGAAATLLGLELGPAGPSGARPWRACAVGDASLFWVRRGELLATFPVVAADQFGSAPLLVRSNPGFRTVAVAAAGTCEPGDRFVLATDAVAARLFKSTQGGSGVDWGRFEALPEDEWRAELDVLRRGNDMVNDDCTLVVLRVNGGDAGAADELPLAAGAPEGAGALGESAPTENPDPPASAQPVTGAPEGEEVIAAGAGDLMIDLQHDPPAPEPDPQPPAGRDDSQEPTDPIA
ncbi:MAG TPA: hypothetical protein VGE74_04500 [Gemmata sp.]